MGSVIIPVKLFVSWQDVATSRDVGKVIAITALLRLDEEKLEEKLRKPHMLLFPL